MSEKKNSLEEKRILQKKLRWYTLEAEDEFNATEMEAMLERLDELESLPEKEDGADFSEPKEALKRFYQKYAGENVEN